jgi:hypothetical protein
MSQTKRDYEIGYGKPPRERPFQKGQSGTARPAREEPAGAPGRRIEQADLRRKITK